MEKKREVPYMGGGAVARDMVYQKHELFYLIGRNIFK
jgi:hypothetical protein